MRKVTTRDGIKKHEPYPINEFPNAVVEYICKGIVHLKAVGHADMTGDQFSRIFSDAVSGYSFGKPVGIADVAWNGCCWSVKTVQQKRPHETRSIRLISGRNSPVYSSGINDPFHDIQATGQSVLDIYNDRIHKARWDHDDLRLLVLIRNMNAQEYSLFERPIAPLVVNNYHWKVNSNNNLCGYEGKQQVFTWQPHGSQFTIHEAVPSSATKFRIVREPRMLEMSHVLELVQFNSDWIEIIQE